MKKVLIGIQARSTSTRLPGKINEIIGKKTVLQHVLDACNKAAYFLSNEKARNPVECSVALLIPKDDPIGPIYKGKVTIFEGSEDDVLSRYFDSMMITGADYVVRITSDTPMIPPHFISRLVQIAINNDCDYTENIDPYIRTSIDGNDTEVLSRKALVWLNKNADSKEFKEHVTMALWKLRPKELKYAHIVSYHDSSSLKISIDTKEDLEKVRAEYNKIQKALYSHPDWLIFRL